MKVLTLIAAMFVIATLAFAPSDATVLSAAESSSILAGQGQVDPIDPIKLTLECVKNQSNCNKCIAGIKCDRDRKLPMCRWTKPETECLAASVDCGAGKKYPRPDCTGTPVISGTVCIANTCF